MVEQTAEFLFARCQNADHGEGEEQIAEITEGGSPRVVVDGEPAAVAVIVEGGLIEPIALADEDAVHRDFGLLGRCAFGRHPETADIVGRCLGAGIAAHFERVELEGEGEGVERVVVIVGEGGDGLACGQMDIAFLRGEEREGCSAQDDEKRGVEHQHRQTAEESGLHDGHDEQQGEQGPCGAEPCRAVDVLGHEGRSLSVFDDGCQAEERHHGEIDDQDESFHCLCGLQRGMGNPQGAKLRNIG